MLEPFKVDTIQKKYKNIFLKRVSAVKNCCRNGMGRIPEFRTLDIIIIINYMYPTSVLE